MDFGSVYLRPTCKFIFNTCKYSVQLYSSSFAVLFLRCVPHRRVKSSNFQKISPIRQVLGDVLMPGRPSRKFIQNDQELSASWGLPPLVLYST